jgi:hypothetical protein
LIKISISTHSTSVSSGENERPKFDQLEVFFAIIGIESENITKRYADVFFGYSSRVKK